VDAAGKEVLKVLTEILERKNNAGVYRGWLKFWNRNWERWLYAMHRITGVGVGIYLVAHIWETSYSATAFLDVSNGGSPVVWTNLMSFLSNEFFHTGLLLVALASVFHALNGVRLIFAEQGLMIGKVKPPTFPMIPSSLKGGQRYFGIAIVIISFILLVYAFYQLFIIGLGW
jgi:succinate dehydrogenase / fumarate reductase cytochrome b subunit